MSYESEYRGEEKYSAPRMLDENRSALKFILLNIVTLGIYSIIFFIPFSFDLNKIASRHDGKETTNFLFAWILGYFTGSIVTMIWYYGVCSRIEAELKRREIDCDFSTSDYWKWYILGSFILVGPYVYMHKQIKAMNLLCESYNIELEHEEQLRKEEEKKEKKWGKNY